MKKSISEIANSLNSIVLLTTFVLLFAHSNAICQTTIPAGNVSGTWTVEGSPYIITGSLTVESGQALIIKPGVEVQFYENVNIVVYTNESIVANGTEDSLIVFTSYKSSPSPGDWYSIIINGTGNKCSFKYAIFEYAFRPLSIQGWASGCNASHNYTLIENCIFRYNSNAGIYVKGAGSSTSGCTIPKMGKANPTIQNNRIYDNDIGIQIVAYDGYMAYGYAGPYVFKNLIYNNASYGIYCDGRDPVEPKLINNTLVNNGLCGISFSDNHDSTHFEIINNIIMQHNVGIISREEKGANIKYNDIWNNTVAYQGTGVATLDISEDPVFSSESSFKIDSVSPCVDAGSPELTDPDNTRSDIGALFYSQHLKANFETDTSYGNIPFTVKFKDKSIGKIINWEWDFGDGSYSNERNPVHIYQTADTFDITLIILGETESDTIVYYEYIKTTEPPVPSFSADKLWGYYPMEVEFINQSTGYISSYWWEFGDGHTSKVQAPKHVYSVPGSYKVNLQVKGIGITSNQLKKDFISVASKYPNLLTDGELDEGGAWIGGYVNNGFAEFTVDKNYMLSSERSVEININQGGSNSWDVALFQYIPIEENGSYQITFHASLVGAKSKEIMVVGDLDVSPYTSYFKKNVTLIDTITTYGPYTIKPTNSNSNTRFIFHLGGTDNIKIYLDAIYFVKIPAEPIANFSAEVTNASINQLIKFTDKSTGDISSWLWDFGDGNTSTAKNPSHQYSDAGTYTVSLTVTGDGGTDTKIITDFISVSPNSISSMLSENQIKIYPNPASSLLHIESESQLNGIIEIYDVQGRLILTEQIMGKKEHKLDIRYLKDGIYYYRLMGDNVISGKFLKYGD